MSDTAAKLTHVDASGKAQMVDVGDKAMTERVAVAEGRITMQPLTLDLILSGEAKKGDVLGVAQVAARRKWNWLPACHTRNDRLEANSVRHDIC